MKDKTKEVLNLVKKISGKSYHQGCFASVSHQYPSDFQRMQNEIDAVYKEIETLLKESNETNI